MERNRVIAVLFAGLVLPASGLAAQSATEPPAVTAQSATASAATTAATIPMYGYSAVPPELAGIDALAVAAMQEWSVPGLAIAVLVDGEIVLSKGYGYRHAEARLPVTPETLFPIASLTKPFTATVISSLVADGVLDWDRPVIEYLPDFALSDDELTRAVTIRDLMTHQSGLPRHDFVWYGTDLSTRDLYQRLRYLEPSRPLREEWQYQNLMFMTAGYLAERVTGRSWQELVRERIFVPLDMRHSTFSLEQLKQSADIAFPYADGPRGRRRVPYRSMDAVGPAGSINATVDELARFVLLHLGDGSFAGRRVLAPEIVRQLRRAQVELPADAVDPALGASRYGLGLVLSQYAGRALAHHGGAVDGFVSLLSFMPEENLGVIVLTNYSGDNPVPWILTRTIYDRLLANDATDWLAYARETEQLRAPEQHRVRVTSGPTGTWRGAPRHPLPADYAGSYWHPAYGQVEIMLSDGELAMRFHGIDAHLEPAGDHRFRVAQGSLSGLTLTFFGNAVSRIDRVAIPWEPRVADIMFVRRMTADGHDDGSG